MKKLTGCLLLVIFVCSGAWAQKASVNGTISDTSEHTALSRAVVSILRPSDSVLVAFTRTDAKGHFKLDSLPPGKFLLMVSYPKYADYIDEINLSTNKDLATGNINIIRKSQLLEEVVVKQRIAAIRVKGDTLEFKADSFKVREGATVEDLLKKLPGIQVNSKGEITAQGEKVQKVLVDGEEFFSDDPAVVTQNLRADALDKVQVFDKKSDQATFTGIDDGQKTKTINLQLKDDKKKGYFGKAKVSGGTPGNYENEAMINSFKGKRKLSLYGTMANTGKAGLGWQDNDKFGSGDNIQYDEENDFYFSMAEDDGMNTWGGAYRGEGLPRAWNGGLHFSKKWNQDRNNFNGNYQYYKQNVELESRSFSQNILPDTQYFNNERVKSFNQNIKHSVTGFYDMQFDSLTSMKLTVSGMDMKGKNQSFYQNEALDASRAMVNSNRRLLSSDGEKQTLNATLLFRKKFSKKGRTLSVNLDEKYNSNNTMGFLQSATDFFVDSIVIRHDSVDQKKDNRSETFALNSKVSYTEPLSKSLFLELNYAFRINNSQATRASFNKSGGPNPKYELIDSLYSNDYTFHVNTHAGGMNLRLNRKKFNASIGSSLSFADFRQRDMSKNILYERSYVNVFPRASFRYNLGTQRRIMLNYSGNTQQPSIEQIQPIRENTNPLNIQVGNPNLKQEFRHNVNLSFFDFKVISGRGVYASIYGSLTDNAISNASYISTNPDSSGKRTNQYININGNYQFQYYMGYWFKLKKLDLNVNLNADAGVSRYNSMVNGVKNISDNTNMGARVNFDKSKENKFNLWVQPHIQWNYSRSSVNTSIVTKYFSSESRAGGSVNLPWKLEIGSEMVYNWRQKTNVFNTQSNLKWDAWLGKKLWKNKVEIRASVFDILDQNIGLQRNATSNFIMDKTYNTIRRYWLLGFIWNFTKSPAGAAPAAK